MTACRPSVKHGGPQRRVPRCRGPPRRYRWLGRVRLDHGSGPPRSPARLWRDRRSDLTLDTFPVRVAQLALHELAVRLARQVVGEVEGLRDLEPAHPRAGEGDDVGGQLVARLLPVVELDDCLDLLAPI